MKILVLTGSPHPNGTSSKLADAFRKGATEAGHDIETVDCARLKINPCIACNNCLRHGVCVWTDDMHKVEEAVRKAEAIVFVSSIYYAGVTAQMKLVMDRFFSFDKVFMENKPKIGLITAAAEEKLSTTCAAVKQFDSLIEYWGCEKIGMVNAYNVPDPESLKGTDFEEQAYRVGKSI